MRVARRRAAALEAPDNGQASACSGEVDTVRRQEHAPNNDHNGAQEDRAASINRKTGHRVRYQKVDAETGEPVDPDDIVMGYEVRKGEFIEITHEELEAIALHSRHTIEREIDDLYKMRPYYVAPDGDAAQEAFALIRDVLERSDRVALRWNGRRATPGRPRGSRGRRWRSGACRRSGSPLPGPAWSAPD
jgi:hypothetical protein